MNPLVAILLWALASLGSYETCDAVATSAGVADAATCTAPPPPEGAAPPPPEGATDDVDKAPRLRLRRGISNGF